ncbi:MAG: hypothetical protein KKE59_04750 [Proteobacteria bacterium]|nr:hypothetical protein [Pseudomonadota bacterium]
MTTTLFLIFNHQFTSHQQSDAHLSLGISKIKELPFELKELWSNIPPHLAEIKEYLDPIKKWLARQAVRGDYVLIQGDFGACYIMVNFAFEIGLIPIYSTTLREALEEHKDDGSVKLIHQFNHQIFRKYGD